MHRFTFILRPELQDLGRMADAMATYARAIAADPTYAKAHYNLGNALRAAIIALCD